MSKTVSDLKGVSAVRGVSSLRSSGGDEQLMSTYYRALMNHKRLTKEKEILERRLKNIDQRMKGFEEVMSRCDSGVKRLLSKKGRKRQKSEENSRDQKTRSMKINF